jgi:hypothetical protein
MLLAKPFPRLIHPAVKPTVTFTEEEHVQMLMYSASRHFSSSTKPKTSRNISVSTVKP